MWVMEFDEPKSKEVVVPKWGTTLHSLCSLPAGDCNFGSALGRATEKDLEDAISYLTANPKNNQSRLKACERELKRRK